MIMGAALAAKALGRNLTLLGNDGDTAALEQIADGKIAAREAGVATVFQEFSLVPTLTVAENVYLGRWPRGRGKVDWAAMRTGAARALADMHVRIDPDAVVASLSVAEQQLVEIAKALA